MFKFFRALKHVVEAIHSAFFVNIQDIMALLSILDRCHLYQYAEELKPLIRKLREKATEIDDEHWKITLLGD